MTPVERIAQLRDEIRRHEELYYIHDAPAVSDAQFDALMNELKSIETAHPELVDPSSPTQRVPNARATRSSASCPPTAR